MQPMCIRPYITGAARLESSFPTEKNPEKCQATSRVDFLKTLGTTFGGWSGHTILAPLISLSNSFQPKCTKSKSCPNVWCICLQFTHWTIQCCKSMPCIDKSAVHFVVLTTKLLESKSVAKRNITMGKYKLFLCFFSLFIQLFTHLL